MAEKWMVDDAGTLINMETRNTYDYMEDIVGLLNEKEERIRQLEDGYEIIDACENCEKEYQERIKELEKENGQLKKDIEYLDEKIKENEWHWNTIDEDRDVWHYKCTQAEKRVKELKTENEQLKKELFEAEKIISLKLQTLATNYT